MKENIMHTVRLIFIVFMALVTIWPFNFPFEGFLVPTIKWYFFTEETKREETNLSIDDMLDRGYTTEQVREVEELKNLRSRAMNLGLDLQGGIRLVLKADFEEYASQMGKRVASLTQQDKDDGMERLIERLRGRVDQFGVSEVPIRRQGEDRIIIEVPGAKDPDVIKNIIIGEGRLEFRFLDEEAMSTIDENTDMAMGSFTNMSKIPENCELLYFYNRKDEFGRRQRGAPAFVKTNAIIGGDMLKYATTTFGDFGDVVVSFELNMEGAAVFGDATAKNIGRRLAIVWDDKLISAPTIQGEIPSGRGQITGMYNEEEARALATILREGALPLRVDIIEQEIVGEAIGKDAVKDGTFALIVAFCLVVLYMLLMYRFSGIIANVAMMVNLILIIAVLSVMHFTLTLPGIAGLVLTIGMAVDANVIIFERIKEELQSHAPFAEAISSGFDRAFWTIFDSNITTLIAAFILWTFGSGPVQGFAATLLVGVTMNLFTALFVTRYVYEQMIISGVVKKPGKLFI